MNLEKGIIHLVVLFTNTGGVDFLKFLKGVTSELSKVKWLKKKEILNLFIVVNVISILMIAYFGLIDFAIYGINMIFK